MCFHAQPGLLLSCSSQCYAHGGGRLQHDPVENYQELVNALIYLVNQGEESGSIRYSGEEADFKKLMDEACLEVKQEDLWETMRWIISSTASPPL